MWYFPTDARDSGNQRPNNFSPTFCPCVVNGALDRQVYHGGSEHSNTGNVSRQTTEAGDVELHAVSEVSHGFVFLTR